MVRKKHGLYNTDTGLPDNSMQATGSGYGVWINEQALTIFGEEGQRLIDESAKHANRYNWLCKEIAERGHQDIAIEYDRRKKQSAAQGRLRDKRNWLAHMEERLLTASTEPERRYFQKQIEKAKKYIVRREHVSNQFDCATFDQTDRQNA